MNFSTCRSDNIVASGNILITRGNIDDLLTDQYLSYVHIDAFGYLMAEKE